MELDLAAFNGRVPVEMMGATPFPAIGTLTYLLTLPPYGFYWFVLSEDAHPPAWHVTAPEQMPDQVTLVLQNKGRPELTEASRRILDDEVMPSYIRRRRWFGAKDESIQRALLVYMVRFTQAPPVRKSISAKSKSGSRAGAPSVISFRSASCGTAKAPTAYRSSRMACRWPACARAAA